MSKKALINTGIQLRYEKPVLTVTDEAWKKKEEKIVIIMQVRKKKKRRKRKITHAYTF